MIAITAVITCCLNNQDPMHKQSLQFPPSQGPRRLFAVLKEGTRQEVDLMAFSSTEARVHGAELLDTEPHRVRVIPIYDF